MSTIEVPPDLIIGHVAGVRVRLVAVFSEEKLHVQCQGMPGAQTRRQNAVFEERFEKFAQRSRPEGHDTLGTPPAMPGEALARLRPQPSDDVGTEYSMDLAALAGYPGTEWDAEWTFDPAIPLDARVLNLRFGGDGSPSVDVSLQLS